MAKLVEAIKGWSNVRAFLDMIALSELGAALLKASEDGYNVVVGATAAHPILFHSYADHPRKLVDLGGGLRSTAAGRYQILAKYYDAYKKQLGLKDFGPIAQDTIALQMIKEQHALPSILAGDFARAVHLCANIWASLPGAGYGQNEHSLKTLQAYFTQAGGKLA